MSIFVDVIDMTMVYIYDSLIVVLIGVIVFLMFYLLAGRYKSTENEVRRYIDEKFRSMYKDIDDGIGDWFTYDEVKPSEEEKCREKKVDEKVKKNKKQNKKTIKN